MFRAYTPILRSNRIIISFTNAAYGVLQASYNDKQTNEKGTWSSNFYILSSSMLSSYMWGIVGILSMYVTLWCM